MQFIKKIVFIAKDILLVRLENNSYFNRERVPYRYIIELPISVCMSLVTAKISKNIDQSDIKSAGISKWNPKSITKDLMRKKDRKY